MSEMNIVDILLGMDAGTLKEVPTSELKAKKLSKATGTDVKVKVRALTGKRITDLTMTAVGKDGSVDYGKTYDTNLLIAVDGVVSPNLKDRQLQEHFGAATPKDLAEILFYPGELVAIANEVRALSGYDKESDEEIKN